MNKNIPHISSPRLNATPIIPTLNIQREIANGEAVNVQRGSVHQAVSNVGRDLDIGLAAAKKKAVKKLPSKYVRFDKDKQNKLKRIKSLKK